MVAPASSRRVQYAPEDPALPSPWRGLVDEETGFVYYWNTQSNETTYVKPNGAPASNGAPGFPSAANGSLQPNAAAVNGHVNGASNGKLAALQMLGGQQQVTNGTSLNGPSSGESLPPGGYKRSADTGEYNDRDAYKRPRMQVPPLNNDADAYKMQHEISVLGSDVPPPFMTFDSARLPPLILRELEAAGFTAPTPIQAQSWPVALRGRDIVAIAKTGSGKTLGYLLPAFLHLENRRSHSRFGPKVLVLAPTRELATQIHEEAMKFGRSSRLLSTCVYGGAPKGPQLRDIERGCDIVIATPGRLNDFLEMRKVSLSQVSYLVLDEADRMLDMGFEPQIRKIVNELPSQRQTLMYTATWPKEVRKIAGDLLANPVQVNIGSTDDLAANKAITQCVEVLPAPDKSRRLEQILRSQDRGAKIIIFCSTKRMCDQLAQSLRRDFGAAAIHGDKSQSERDYVLTQFKTGKSPVLVATDVAARGLDIKDIRVVINYDFPTGVEDYVHRIGRTGRAGATGLAHTFFTDQDAKHAKDLIKVLEGANQVVPLGLRTFAARGFYGKPRNRWESSTGRNGSNTGNRGPAGDAYGGGFGSRGHSHAPRASSRDNSRGFENGDSHTRGRYGDSKPERRRSYSRSRSRSPNPRSSRSSYERSRGRSKSPRSRFSDAAPYPSAPAPTSGWNW